MGQMDICKPDQKGAINVDCLRVRGSPHDESGLPDAQIIQVPPCNYGQRIFSGRYLLHEKENFFPNSEKQFAGIETDRGRCGWRGGRECCRRARGSDRGRDRGHDDGQSRGERENPGFFRNEEESDERGEGGEAKAASAEGPTACDLFKK